MQIDPQIQYWAHMLDESRHASYYDVYMQEHPEDKHDILIDSLIGEFANSLKKNNIKEADIALCAYDDNFLDKTRKKIAMQYHWELIPAKTYAAIISRMVALSHRAKGQRFNETDEISFDDVSHMVSRRTIEQCLDIICHNTNILEANNAIILDGKFGSQKYEKIFQKHGLQEVSRYSSWKDEWVKDYQTIIDLYVAWAAYAKGQASEPYVCDSDNGPKELKKVLESIEYSVDIIDLVVALNKALDVVHFRSDLAAAFIEGGKQTCALVSNLPDKFVI